MRACRVVSASGLSRRGGGYMILDDRPLYFSPIFTTAMPMSRFAVTVLLKTLISRILGMMRSTTCRRHFRMPGTPRAAAEMRYFCRAGPEAWRDDGTNYRQLHDDIQMMMMHNCGLCILRWFAMIYDYFLTFLPSQFRNRLPEFMPNLLMQLLFWEEVSFRYCRMAFIGSTILRWQIDSSAISLISPHAMLDFREFSAKPLRAVLPHAKQAGQALGACRLSFGQCDYLREAMSIILAFATIMTPYPRFSAFWMPAI